MWFGMALVVYYIYECMSVKTKEILYSCLIQDTLATTLRQPCNGDPRGKRKRYGPQTTRRRTVEEEMSSILLVADRDRWRELFAALKDATGRTGR